MGSRAASSALWGARGGMKPVVGVESHFGTLSGVVVFNILAAWPLWRIYRRCGLPGWWSLIAFAPLVGLVAAVALLGHARWPRLPSRPSAVAPKARRPVRLPQAPTE